MDEIHTIQAHGFSEGCPIDYRYIYLQTHVLHIFFKNVPLFENVRHFILNDPKMNSIYFKQIVGMIPNIKKFNFFQMKKIQCKDKEEVLNSENCCFKLFEMIPRLQSLRHFSTHFRFIGKQLFECLDRFPNLSYLGIFCLHKSENDQAYEND